MDAACTHSTSPVQKRPQVPRVWQKNVAPHGGVGGRYLRTQRSVGRRAPESAWDQHGSTPTSNQKYLQNKICILKKKGLWIHGSFISFHWKNGKLLGKCPGSRVDVDSFNQMWIKSPQKLRSQAWVFCCAPHELPTVVEPRFTSKRHPKKKRGSKMSFLNWFKCHLPKLLLEVFHFELKPSLSSQRAVRVGQERWPGSEELVRDWDFQSHPSRVLNAWKQRKV